MAAQPIPDNYQNLISILSMYAPHTCVAAIDWYREALGATERMRIPGPNNSTVHAEIDLGNCVLMMHDILPEMPKPAGAPDLGPACLMYYVADVDAAYQRAIEAGATPFSEPKDWFWGDRNGSFVDPFGNLWTVSTRVEDVAPEEMMARMAAMHE